MEVSVRPGARIGGEAVVPGDKSIAHRWLILAACGDGTSELGEVPPSLDVASTARCLATLAPEARAELERWAEGARGRGKADGFTTNNAHPRRRAPALKVRGGGWASLEGSRHPLDCGNSGTSLRLLAGIASGSTFETVLTGDESLRRRPMERIARPLRQMGAEVRTTDGRPPVVVRGGSLHGIEHRTAVPSAQVKGSVLLAGLRAEGLTTVIEPTDTRDHTERALAELGGPVTVEPNRVSVRAFQPPAFAAEVPGDVSSAAADLDHRMAMALAVAALGARGPSRIDGIESAEVSFPGFLGVLSRLGARIEVEG